MCLRYSVFPNIQGASPYGLRTSWVNPTTQTIGAITVNSDGLPVNNTVTATSGGLGATPVNFSISATNSNPLFGTSSTVQPAGLYGLCLIRFN